MKYWESMNTKLFTALLALLVWVGACSAPQQEAPSTADTAIPTKNEATPGQQTSASGAEEAEELLVKEAENAPLSDTAFVNVASLHPDFMFDMRYATADNFLNAAVYPCANCLLRYEVARALVKANEAFMKQGYRIKFYDCYRPLDVQKKMWAVMPDSRYVANPYKSGSIHNRGGAVDLTLVDKSGKELDMGTAFDHFGEEAHHDYQLLSDEVKLNRERLRKGLEAQGFKALDTEWWHYLWGEKGRYSLANVSLCE